MRMIRWQRKLNGYEDLEPYIELIHGDSRLPNGEYLDIKETPENQNAHRRIHVYERGNQFMLLKDILGTYMWVSPIPEELLRRNGLAQRKIEWQQRWMKDVMVYPGRKFLSEDERGVYPAAEERSNRSLKIARLLF